MRFLFSIYEWNGGGDCQGLSFYGKHIFGQIKDTRSLGGSVRSGSGLSPEGSNFSKLIKSSFD